MHSLVVEAQRSGNPPRFALVAAVVGPSVVIADTSVQQISKRLMQTSWQFKAFERVGWFPDVAIDVRVRHAGFADGSRIPGPVTLFELGIALRL